MAQSILEWRGNEGPRFSQRRDNCEIVEIHWQRLKIFSGTTGPNSTKLGTKYPWGKGIQICSNEVQCLTHRGDNWEIIKINWQLLKIFFSGTTGPNSTKLGTEHPWVKEIQICSNKGPHPCQKGKQLWNCKNTLKTLKNLLL